MNIKKTSLLVMILFSHVYISYTAAGEEKESDRLGQTSFRDEVIDRFKTRYAPLSQGFDLIGLNYDDFLETHREFIPEDGNEDEGIENNFMHNIVVKAENIIIEIMQIILEQGFKQAIDNKTDIDTLTQQKFDYAIYYKLSIGSKILQNLINIPNLLTDAIRGNNLEVVNKLIIAGADVNVRDNNSEIPLMYAAEHGHKEIVQVLLAAGANVNIVNNHGVTSLMDASHNGHVEIVQMLLTAGADVNIRNNDDGLTPLMYASHDGDVEIVQMLLTAGAGESINIQTNWGHTALMIASLMIESLKCYKEVVQVLIVAGADVNIRDNNGQTAIDVADAPMKLVIQQAVGQREALELEKVRVKYLNYDLD